MDKKLYKLVKEQGEILRFSIALYENATDKKHTKLAKQIAKKFASTFGKFCEENELELSSGFVDAPKVGASTYLGVRRKGSETMLMMILTPHDVIEITPLQEEPNA